MSSTPKPSSTASPALRVFKEKAFVREARRLRISDAELCKAAMDLEEGKGDDLGGNVWKKRLQRNESRAIVATKPGAFWIFSFVFRKSDRGNIDGDELKAFRKLAASYGEVGVAGMERLVIGGHMVEICNEREGPESICAPPRSKAGEGRE